MNKFFLSLTFVLGQQVPSHSQYTPHWPPTYCEDQCLREYSITADGHLESYRHALQSIVDQALLAIISSWVGYLSDRSGPGWATVAATTMALYQANAFNQAIFYAELSDCKTCNQK